MNKKDANDEPESGVVNAAKSAETSATTAGTEPPGNRPCMNPELQKAKEVMAPDARDIEILNNNLPELLNKMPEEVRSSVNVSKMLTSLDAGVYDGALSYAWNVVVDGLKKKLLRSNFHLLNTDITADDINDMLDDKLLEQCKKLRLISNSTYLRLTQYRDLRNNFSSAHPAKGPLYIFDCLAFINYCCCQTFAESKTLIGVDVKKFLKFVNDGNASQQQIDAWVKALLNTNEEQREWTFFSLYGIWCDPRKTQEVRLTALEVCRGILRSISENWFHKLDLQHEEYRRKDVRWQIEASQWFYASLGIIKRLRDEELYELYLSTCSRLMHAHDSQDNFAGEEVHAENLANLVSLCSIPGDILTPYVQTVVTCAVGNEHGVSYAALPHYQQMIGKFSSEAIQALLIVTAPSSNSKVAQRIRVHETCKAHFQRVLRWLDQEVLTEMLGDKYQNVLADGVRKLKGPDEENNT